MVPDWARMGPIGFPPAVGVLSMAGLGALLAFRGEPISTPTLQGIHQLKQPSAVGGVGKPCDFDGGIGGQAEAGLGERNWPELSLSR